jgi:hypothetical protein
MGCFRQNQLIDLHRTGATTMQGLASTRFTQGITVCTVAICVSGCGAPWKMSPDYLASIGVREGARYWVAEQKLASEGYRCYVSGAKRENFDCTKTKGIFPSCILRVAFEVDDKNLISTLRVADPACIGTL